MILKYQIAVEDVILALRYDYEKNRGSLGGRSCFIDTMKGIIEKAFKKNGTMKRVQANKYRILFRSTQDDLELALAWMRQNGFIVEQVKSLGNIDR